MKKKQYISAILLLFSSFFALATDATVKDEKKSGDLKSEIKAYIRHHLEDTHDFSIGSYTTDEGMKKYIGFKRKLQRFPIKYTITEILVFFLKFRPSAMKKLKIIIGNIMYD